MVWRPLIFAAILLAAPAFAQDPRTLSVTGLGEVSTAPDMATVRAGVETSARRADEALRDNSARMTKVLETLAGLGIEPRDIQTSGLSLYPQYDNRTTGQGRGIAQYSAQNTLTIRVRDIDGLGRVLDTINQAGINEIQSISFGLQDNSGQLDAARTLAVSDARAKAELYAGAAGVSLGQVLSISEPGSNSGPVPMGMARAESMAIDVPIAAGELITSARIDIVFEIE